MKLFLYVSHTIEVLSNNIKLEFSQYIQILPRKNSSTCICFIAKMYTEN